MQHHIPIDVPEELLAMICRQYGVKRMAMFGSVLREDFSDASDVDMLVEFEEGRTPGLSFFTLQQDLSEALGRKVDLNTALSLSQYFRAEVLDTARVIYDSA